ncbi:ABC transporter ATP-binding protein [Deinococcus sp.]|uniref:ABC transporter ATP-binding protein n=1 Tax=Deinococcus sp. TaxID=47478 RepID=UPI002869E2E0|nr:ABC transporter ATP-binding protein [Deinococcus sp.]
MTRDQRPIPPAPLLETRGLSKAFRGLVALNGHAITVWERDIVGVIGPNGSGKSTLFNVVTGFLKPTAGKVLLRGVPISGRPPAQVSRLGIARTFQGTRLFGQLSVLDNVLVAAQLRHPTSLPGAVLNTAGSRAARRAAADTAHELLALMGLEQRAGQRAASLPYGDGRRLEIARALATRPALLMLDEPAAGLNSGETRALATLIGEVRDRYGVAVIVIEHDMDLVMTLCERVQVLAQGAVIGEGTPAEIQASPRVRNAYLGSESDDAA